MTIEKAIEEFEKGAKITWNGKPTANAKECQQMTKWLEELKQLREQTRWIPVSERLPEEAGMYLCSYDDDYIDTSYFDISMNEFNIFHEQVTAWMPLPLPYKQEVEENEKT